MTAPTWFLIGVAAGIAGNAVYLLARALRRAFRSRIHTLATRIDDLLDDPEPDEPEPDDHVEDDVWDRDLRQLLTDTID